MYYLLGNFVFLLFIFAWAAKDTPNRTIKETWFKTLTLMLPALVILKVCGMVTDTTKEMMIYEGVSTFILDGSLLVVLLILDTVLTIVKRKRKPEPCHR